MSKKHELVGVTEYANYIADCLPNTAAVCLGGSLTDGPAEHDDLTDVDLFCYLNSPLPELGSISQCIGRAATFTQLRRRNELVEYRCKIGCRDTNVKIFEASRIDDFLRRSPSIDEVYLEELESYLRFEILAESDGRVRGLLRKARREISDKIGELANHALEVYGKSVSVVIRQGLHRDGLETVAAMNLSTAVNTLLCLFFLVGGEVPPPFKWRASRRKLETMHRGERVYGALSHWLNDPDALCPTSGLRHLREIEGEVADFDTSPWSTYADDTWWWQGYEYVATTQKDINQHISNPASHIA